MLKKILSNFLDALFPRSCVGCGAPNEDFCVSCQSQAKPAGAPDIADTFAVWSYQDTSVRRAILDLKYRGAKRLASVFATAMYDKLLEELSEREVFYNPLSSAQEKILLLPVPLSKKRERERGFNQSGIIASALASLDPATFVLSKDALVKSRETPHQSSFKDRETRLKNLAGSFQVSNPEAVRGKVVIIVDDVTTTGATIAECRKVLLEAGARRVYGAAVAH